MVTAAARRAFAGPVLYGVRKKDLVNPLSSAAQPLAVVFSSWTHADNLPATLSPSRTEVPCPSFLHILALALI